MSFHIPPRTSSNSLPLPIPVPAIIVQPIIDTYKQHYADKCHKIYLDITIICKHLRAREHIPLNTKKQKERIVNDLTDKKRKRKLCASTIEKQKANHPWGKLSAKDTAKRVGFHIRCPIDPILAIFFCAVLK